MPRQLAHHPRQPSAPRPARSEHPDDVLGSYAAGFGAIVAQSYPQLLYLPIPLCYLLLEFPDPFVLLPYFSMDQFQLLVLIALSGTRLSREGFELTCERFY